MCVLIDTSAWRLIRNGLLIIELLGGLGHFFMKFAPQRPGAKRKKRQLDISNALSAKIMDRQQADGDSECQAFLAGGFQLLQKLLVLLLFLHILNSFCKSHGGFLHLATCRHYCL